MKGKKITLEETSPFKTVIWVKSGFWSILICHLSDCLFYPTSGNISECIFSVLPHTVSLTKQGSNPNGAKHTLKVWFGAAVGDFSVANCTKSFLLGNNGHI